MRAGVTIAPGIYGGSRLEAPPVVPPVNVLARYNAALGEGQGFVTTTGRLSQITDTSGNARHLTNPAASDRPVSGAFGAGALAAQPAYVFTATTEWAYSDDPVLAALMNTETPTFELDMAFVMDTVAAGAIIAWTRTDTNEPNCFIGVAPNGELRLQRRAITATARTIDTGIVMEAGVENLVTITFEAGVYNIWLNGVQIAVDMSFGGTPAIGNLTLTRFVMGARAMISASLPFVGKVQYLEIRVPL